MDRSQQRPRPIDERDLLSDLNQQATLARRRSMLFWILVCVLVGIIFGHFTH